LQEDLLVDKQNWGVLKDGTKIELSEALFPRRG
jgi:hypothetical protein